MSSSRHRAYSDPSLPPSPSITTSTRITNSFFPTVPQTDYTSEQSYNPYIPHPVRSALTEASLAALSFSETQSSDRYRYTIEDIGFDRQPPTPSTTSVSDEGEEGEGYEERKEEKARGRGRWIDRKGKGRAVDVEEEEEKGGSGIAGRLPEEVLTHIFRLLPARHLLPIMLVSRSWCLSGYLLQWSRPNITSTTQLASLVRILNTPQEALSLPYHTSIRRINLNLIGADLSSDLFTPLKVCTRLERIVMVGSGRVSASALREVIECLPDLIAIDLSNTVAVDDSVLAVLGRTCGRLQGLNVSGCKSVGDEGVRAIAKGCRMIRRMKLAGCHRLTDESIIQLLRSCPLILELDIASVPQLRDTSIYAMWLNSIHLRELKLGKNDNFTSGSIPDLPTLYYESNDSITHYSNPLWINYLERNNHHLPLLSPSITTRNRALTVDSYIKRERETRGIVDIHLLRPLAPTFDHLRIVDLTGCSEFDDQALINLVKSAPKLRNLTLAKCVKLTDLGMEHVAILGKQLHYLHLGHVDKITDVAMTKIARSCTRLRYIDVAGCHHLTDLSVFELSSNLSKLRRIGLVKVVNLTDEGVYALAERHSSLERIHLSFCDNISVRAITFLLNRLMKLSHLSLTSVKAFRNEEMQRFRKDIPPEFSEHQSASFCVYSHHGIIALRHYLNQKQSAENGGGGSDTSTTRRDSGSSASSLNLGVVNSREEGVWVGPAYPSGGNRGEGTSVWNTEEDHRRSWTHTPNHLLDVDQEMMDVGTSNHRMGDQVYRRVSTPTLPIPPISRSSLSRSVVRPRGPRNEGSQRVPGEWPSQVSNQPTWGQVGSSGMAWGYGDDMRRSSSGEVRVNRSTRERAVAPVLLGPPVSTHTSSAPTSRYRRGVQTSTPPTTIPSYLTQYSTPPSSFPGQTHRSNNILIPDNIPDPTSVQVHTQEPEEYISTFMSRSRSSSVTNALTDLAGRLRRPSLNLGAAVGAVGDVAPLRWVAEMVGYGGGTAGGGADEGGTDGEQRGS